MPIEIDNSGDYSGPPHRGGLVPFGKYRGKPIEAMLQDPAYCEWFMSQPEMKQKYGNVYQVVINNFGEPSETPESNEMQAKFLNTEFRIKFTLSAIANLLEFDNQEGLIAASLFAAEDVANVKAGMKIDNARSFYNSQQWTAEGENGHKRFRASVSYVDFEVAIPEFESKGTDVAFRVKGRGIEYVRTCEVAHGKSWEEDRRWDARNDTGSYGRREDQPVCNYSWRHKTSFRIEIKPQVGDDFPAILRQMRRSRSNVLFTRSYGGIGVDEATFVDYFATQGIRVIFENDVLSQVIPEPFLFNGMDVQKAVVEHIKTLNDHKNDQKAN